MLMIQIQIPISKKMEEFVASEIRVVKPNLSETLSPVAVIVAK